MTSEKPRYIRNCSGCLIKICDEDILNNSDFIPIGLTSVNNSGEDIYFYFVHNVKNCQTTFAIAKKDIEHLIEETITNDNLYLTEKCNNYCYDIKSLEVCNNDCVNAPFRRFLLKIIKNRKK
ncbi:MAG: hypothetical protein ABIJ45_06255 [Candidatus Zixiibacteriota bacterium]